MLLRRNQRQELAAVTQESTLFEGLCRDFLLLVVIYMVWSWASFLTSFGVFTYNMKLVMVIRAPASWDCWGD